MWGQGSRTDRLVSSGSAGGSGGNGIKKSAIMHRFAKESCCAARHRALAGLREIVAGQDDDRKRCAFPGELGLHVEPVHVRHVQIKNHAIRQTSLERFQKILAGLERFHGQTGGTH